MSMTMTGSAAMASSTATNTTMGSMGMHGGNGCKISMLWNWNVMNACFISSTWRITSKGMFAGSCIGVVLLVMSLEFLRRAGHEFDKYIAGKPHLCSGLLIPKSPNTGSVDPPPSLQKRAVRPSLLQHTLRSLLHMVQFGVAYFVMLLAMYYNGYIIICILIGSFLGAFVFSWKSEEENDACKVTVCCG